MSDVKLACGTGPLAVEAIIAHYGAIPVIFITGTPEACQPCPAPSVILEKPIRDRQVQDAFRNLIPLLP